MKTIAIIPARGGSKRIPRKNIKDFLGKPIMAYSIELALTCGLFDIVMVSTDDDEIRSIALDLGADVPFMRSPSTSDDHATTASVIKEVLDRYAGLGKVFDFACCIYPTAPLLTRDTLTKAFGLLVENGFTSVFPTVPYGYPIWRSLKIDQRTNQVEMNWPENISARSQDLPPAFHDAGQFYWIECGRFQKDLALFTNNSGTIVLSELEVQDIDNEIDWKLAELKATLLK